ncbi:flavodoxin FldA [Synechococcus sp. Nb3U1]|uniref:flavodoxin FldA n=1 Tax=Synechococcus sp. Nb3U1 TaxID=1914529 RepID=UPI001F257344|nr:flavodoxin FldA [Synechococcus sp. Nb3U1]MCF2970280.1 flavodoxin FldA [Synechococcus sp. Nb3U1]
MAKVGLFFGTQTGNTETVAEMIQKELGEENVDLIDISEASIEDFDKYNYLIIGCPTWNIGELQSDWDGFFPNLDEIDFSGKTVAYFGVGDQFGYPDNFQDAMGILAEKIAERGGKNVGSWPIDGYEFNESRGLVNGQFVGLALDEDNQSELTEKRVKEWTAKLKPTFGL